jgi:hypothetical protein
LGYIACRDGGAEENSVPLARDLHPEFGYMGSGPGLWRKVGFVVVFLTFGLVAGLSGVTVFTPGPEPDPMQAMALAPAEALIRLPLPPADSQADIPALPQRSIKAGRIKPPTCREDAMENLGGDCTPARASKPVPAANERPAIAAVAIGHRDEPALLPPRETMPSAAMAPDVSALPADSAEAAPVPTVTEQPPAAVKKARPRTQHVQRREREYARSSRGSSFYQSGYARLW